jgi:hypothetical protein
MHTAHTARERHLRSGLVRSRKLDIALLGAKVMARFYNIKPDVVDKVLGVGVYAAWQQVLDSFIEEETRAYANAERYAQVWAAGLRTQLQADLAFAEQIADDYNTFLERTTATGMANPKDGENMIDVFVLAISVLTAVNDLLDEIVDLGIAAMLGALYAASLQAEARTLQKQLDKLKALIEKAQREVKEAYAQTVFNVAVTGVLACAGPLGWLTLGAVGLTQMIADTYLGPSTSDAATWGSRGTTTLGTAASASEKYLAESSRMLKVAKPAGKALPVVGFFFDVNEIAVGYAIVDELEKQMVATKDAHDKLLDKIKMVRGVFTNLASRMEKLRKEVEKRSTGWVAEIRRDLEDEMRRTGYRPRI